MQTHISKRGHGMLLWYCTKHGLFYQLIQTFVNSNLHDTYEPTLSVKPNKSICSIKISFAVRLLRLPDMN